MPNITNYSPLIQSMFGRKGTSWGTGSTLPGVFQFSQLNSSLVMSSREQEKVYLLINRLHCPCHSQ